MAFYRQLFDVSLCTPLMALLLILYISCFGTNSSCGLAMAIQQNEIENMITSSGLTPEEETLFRKIVEEMASDNETLWYDTGYAPDMHLLNKDFTDLKVVLKALSLARSGMGVIDAIETRLDDIEAKNKKAMGLSAEQEKKTILPYRIVTTNRNLVFEIENHDCLNKTKAVVPSNKTLYDLGGFWHGRGDNVHVSFNCPTEYDFDRSAALKLLQKWRARSRSKRATDDENTSVNIVQVNLTITSEVFEKSMLNALSSTYSRLVNNLTTEIDEIFQDKPEYKRVNDFSFRSGSVIATFHIEITGQNSVATVMYALGNATVGGRLGGSDFIVSHTEVKQYVDEHAVYSLWQPWSACTKTCGSGIQTRHRTCNSTAPLACAHLGPSTETLTCYIKYCSQECNIVFNNQSADRGSFSSPVGDGNLYPALAECVWQIIVDENHTIVAYFTEFDVEIDKKCKYDHVSVYDEAVPPQSLNSRNELMRFCGHATPPRSIPAYGYPINSSDNALTFYFKTDSTKQYRGFNVSWYKTLKFHLRDANVIPQSVATLSIVLNPWSHTKGAMVPFGEATTCPNSLGNEDCFFLGEQMVISRIIAVFMNKQDRTGPNKLILVTFEHVLDEKLFPSAYRTRKTCVTWDHTISSPRYGAWTRRGCYTAFSNLTHTHCKCDHTGVFAVVGETEVPAKELQLKGNTYFGLAVSLLFVIMTVYSLATKEERTTGELFHLYETFVAGLLLIIFMIGANVAAQKELCGFLAFCVYYLILSQFTWMLLTVFWIQNLLKRFLSEKVKIKMVYFVLGWVIPLILAGVAGKVNIDNKGNDENVCWASITGAGTVWGYGAPVFVMLLINIGIFVYLLLPNSKEKYDYQNMRPRVVKEILTMVFFLTAWMTGVNVTVDDSFRNQYFFCIFLILQGVSNYVMCYEKTELFWKSEEPVTEIKPDHDMEYVDKSQEIVLEENEENKDDTNDQTRMTVKTLKNLNIYKENGVFVIEA